MPALRISISDNADEVFAGIQAFNDAIVSVATPRALNRLRDQASTAGFRVAASLYGINVSTFSQYTTLSYASAQTLEASINVKGAGFPLYVLKPRQTRAGVTVVIKGKRVLIPHTFIAMMPNGHVGVFARGAYGARSSRQITGTGQSFGKFTFGRKRLPINELFTFTPGEAFDNPEVTKAMDARVANQATAVLQQEIRFATGIATT